MGSRVLLAFVSALLLLGCPAPPGGGDDDTTPEPDPFADHVFDTETFAAPIVATVGLRGNEVAADQLIVVLDQGAALQPVLDALGASLLGQIPRLNAYQLGLGTATVVDLEAAWTAATALPEVAGATWNVVQDLDDSPYCLLDDDNTKNVQSVNRCPLRDVQYYAAARILREIGDRMVLSPVKVAVVDSGLQLDFGAHDDVHVLNLDNPSAEPIDNNGHGTRVSGIIAADDGDGSTNGIASIVLGSRIALEVGGFSSDTFASLAAVKRAVFDGHADVVNMSYGARYTAADSAQQATIMGLYQELVADAPNTVFLTSAGNVNEELTTTNASPAGLQAPNFINVGGLQHCEPMERWVHSDPYYGTAWGSLIDISAPAQLVPVLPYGPTIAVYDPGGPPIYKSGTSYSSPMVAASAAIMKSMNPSLTGAQIKTYLTDYAYLTDSTINWRRFILVTPIAQMLIDMPASADVLDLIDADEDLGVWDINGQMLNRICEGVDLSVSGRGSWTFFPDAAVAAGFINDMGYGATFGFEEDEDASFFMTQADGGFELDHPYGIPEPMAVGFTETDDDLVTNGVGGEIVFEACAITDRNPLDETPMMVQVRGTGEGALDGFLGSVPVTYSFETRFNMPVIIYPGSSVIPVLEQVCAGGTL